MSKSRVSCVVCTVCSGAWVLTLSRGIQLYQFRQIFELQNMDIYSGAWVLTLQLDVHILGRDTFYFSYIGHTFNASGYHLQPPTKRLCPGSKRNQIRHSTVSIHSFSSCPAECSRIQNMVEVIETLLLVACTPHQTQK